MPGSGGLDGFLFISGNLLAFVVADSVAAMAMQGREPWRRVLAAWSGFPLVILALLLSLGSAGKLTAVLAVEVLTLAAAGAVAARLWLWRRRGTSAFRPPPAGAVEAGAVEEREDLAAPIAVVLLAGFGGVLAARCCFDGTSFFEDDLSYHAPAAAHWLVDGRLYLAPFSYQAYYPLNAELMSLWFMLPFHGDAFASLAGLYWASLASLAIIALGLIQGHGRSATLLGAALFLASPVVAGMVATFSAADVAAPAAALAALAFAIPSAGDDEPCERRADAAYSGLLAGFATGTKVSFAPVALILFCYWLFARRPAKDRGGRASAAALFAVGVAAASAHWYARNLFLSGNPLFPAALGPFSGPLSAAEQNRTRLITWILGAPLDWRQWLYLGEYFLKWPLGLSFLSLLGYGVALLRQVRRGKALPAALAASPAGALESRRSCLRSLLLLVGLSYAFLYPLLPFSGTVNAPDADLVIIRRYLIVPFAIGLVFFSELCERGQCGRPYFFALALLAAVTAWPGTGSARLFALTSGGAALGLWALRRKLKALLLSRAWTVLQVASLSLLLAAMVAWAPYKQQRTDVSLYRSAGRNSAAAPVLQALETLPAGSRLASFGELAYRYYPTFGRKLQLVPVNVETDGTPSQPLHLRWQVEKKTLWDFSDQHADLGGLVENLLKSGVEYVLVTKWAGDQWPRHKLALEEQLAARSAGVQPIYSDAYSAIWKLPAPGRRGSGGKWEGNP